MAICPIWFRFISAPVLSCRVHNRPGRPVPPQRIHTELLAQVNLRFAVIRAVRLELYNVELHAGQRRAHEVELVLGLDDKFVVTIPVSPFLLLFGQCPIVALSTPLLARASDPAIENLTTCETYRISEM